MSIRGEIIEELQADGRRLRAEKSRLENRVASLEAENAKLVAVIGALDDGFNPCEPCGELFAKCLDETCKPRTLWVAELVRLAEEYRRSLIAFKRRDVGVSVSDQINTGAALINHAYNNGVDP